MYENNSFEVPTPTGIFEREDFQDLNESVDSDRPEALKAALEATRVEFMPTSTPHEFSKSIEALMNGLNQKKSSSEEIARIKTFLNTLARSLANV